MAAFEAFKDANFNYLRNLVDELSKVECHEYFDREFQRMNEFNGRVQDWIRRADEAARLHLQINPEDSVSQSGRSGHALDYCDSLRSRPYPERIQFLMSKNLCLGCLSNNHTARNCPERKTCSFPNCSKKHPTVLHTNSTVRSRPAADSPTIPTSNEETTRVHNGMASLDEDTRNTGGASFPEIGMAVVPVKVWTKGSETPTITYAFLDSGSSSTFCSETLMRQLGISGAETKISLTTLEKKDTIIDSFILRALPSQTWTKMSILNCPRFTRDLGFLFLRMIHPSRLMWTDGRT